MTDFTSPECFGASLKGLWVIQVLVSLFLAVLFIQSGLDKVTDRSGNLSWLTGHFANSPFRKFVPLLLATLTGLELAAGFVSAVGVAEVLISSTFCAATLGTILSGVTLLALFLGQRVAKDYAGAASLVPYFILVIVDLYLLAT